MGYYLFEDIQNLPASLIVTEIQLFDCFVFNQSFIDLVESIAIHVLSNKFQFLDRLIDAQDFTDYAGI